MDKYNKDLMERYIYEASRYLEYEESQFLKEDIESIVCSQIEEGKDIISVLNTLGNPYALGSKYMKKGNLLISGRYYDLYTKTLKLGIGSILLGNIIFLIYVMFGFGFNMPSVADVLENIIEAMITVFAFVTLSFTFVERLKTKKILESMVEDWDSRSLIDKRRNGKPKNISFASFMFFTTIYVISIVYYNSYSSLEYSVGQRLKYIFIIALALSVFKGVIKVTGQRYDTRGKYILLFINIFLIFIFSAVLYFNYITISDIFIYFAVVISIIMACVDIYRIQKRPRLKKN